MEADIDMARITVSAITPLTWCRTKSHSAPVPENLPSCDTLWLMPGAAAKRVGVNRKTIQRWMDEGDLPYDSNVIPGFRCVKPADLDAVARSKGHPRPKHADLEEAS